MNYRRKRPRKSPRACRMCKPRRAAGNSASKWSRIRHHSVVARDPLMDESTRGRHKVAPEMAA